MKRVALLGFPVGHSRSPAMHNAAFEALGLDWRYEAIAVEPERYEALVRSLPERGFVGANVTIPHKLAALEAADSASPVAAAVGAANTLVFGPEGVRADNTDVGGFIAALRERAPAPPEGTSAIVLGAGGAARAVVYGLALEGAREIAVWNRTPERAMALVDDLARSVPGTRLSVTDAPLDRRVDLLVNATSVGMEVAERDQPDAGAPFKQLPISADKLANATVVADVVYSDRGTPLTQEAAARGITFVEGIDILVHQGAASFELWTGMDAPVEVMRHGARKR